MLRLIVGVMVFICLIDSSSVTAQAIAAAKSGQGMAKIPEYITVSFDNTPLQEAIYTISKRSGRTIVFVSNLLPSKKVTYQGNDVTPMAALEAILGGTGLQANGKPNGTIALLHLAKENGARGQGAIVGNIIDARTGKGVQGANVAVGHDPGVTTSEDGAFRVTGVRSGSRIVTVRSVGYAKQSRTIIVGEGSTVTADFKLERSANVLDQIVVTGTVAQTELKAVPNAITVITAKQIEERGITRIDQLFRGDVPGLFSVNMGSSAPLGEVIMFSRGATAFDDGLSAGTSFGTNPIKTYIDGIELADSKYLSQIDPKSIERIEILSGPQASTIYGSNAINGVMQIFTKRGTISRPQLTLNMLSGWVENDFSSASTPQHDYSAQLSGVEGRLSYNAGGSWNYMGPWTPAMQTSRTSGFGGARLDLTTSVGRVTADMTLRRSATQNQQRGSNQQTFTGYQESGWWSSENIQISLSAPTTNIFTGQSVGLTIWYTPTPWWSHELGSGQDVSNTETRYMARGYAFVSDTTLGLYQSHTDRRSLRYTTTVRLPLTSLVQATIIAGTDAWQNLTSSMSVSPQTLTGSLIGSTSVTRRPGHNAGSFLQTQLALKDRLFLTYGLRAEWSPDYGEKAQPNYAPKYGVAYTQEFGNVTAKLRGSYGLATRPPDPQFKASRAAPPSTTLLWGAVERLANPDLSPQLQRGGEGGLEFYLANRASLVVTRYNQTVDGLIAKVYPVDSVDLLPEWQAVYGSGLFYYKQAQYLNVGSIRNQGWELQSSKATIEPEISLHRLLYSISLIVFDSLLT